MYTSKSVTFCKNNVMILRVGKKVAVHSYNYSKITAASKGRLENLQFSSKQHPLVLFTTDNTEVFAALNWS